MYYFSYGTDMNLSDFGQWCEAHKIRHLRILSKEPAILHNFHLLFNHYSTEFQCGVANINMEKDKSVEGVLYKIPDEEFWIIKKRNSVPGIYEEYIDPITVCLYDNTPISRVKTFYIPADRCQAGLKPSKKYINIILAGATAEKLHPEYIKIIESLPTLDD